MLVILWKTVSVIFFLGLPLKFIKEEDIFVEGRRNAFKRGENSLQANELAAGEKSF